MALPAEKSKTAVQGAPQNSAAVGRKLWKAGELARRTGLTRQSLHQYVLLGLLVPVDTTKGGQRLFDADAIKTVKLIHDLCENGYTLRDIRDIFFKTRG